MNYSHLRGKSIGEINIKMICNLQLFKRGRIIKCKGKVRYKLGLLNAKLLTIINFSKICGVLVFSSKNTGIIKQINASSYDRKKNFVSY